MFGTKNSFVSTFVRIVKEQFVLHRIFSLVAKKNPQFADF